VAELLAKHQELVLTELRVCEQTYYDSFDHLVTQGVNLAALMANGLKRELMPATEEERKKQLRDFFVSYAVSWRTKEHNQRRLQRLVMDAHAPIELRVNLVVAQFEEWYQVFGIQTGDYLYIPPEERIRIF
jgi:predicted metalloendopeptidase